MSKQTDGSAINIEVKLAEAELYAKHGLLDNAHDAYDELLRHLGEADHPLRARMEEGLRALNPREQSINTPPAADQGPLSKNECLERYENCLGLMEAGFYSEAEGQLKALLDSGYRTGALQAKIGECCLRQSQPFEALEFLEAAIKAPDLANTEELLDILDRLTTTYETIGATASAIKTLEQLVQLNPAFRNAVSRLKRLSKTAQKFGRFYFLIKENLLSEEKLERAKESAKQKNKTIDHVLMEEFGIEKAQLGRALSEHYGCKFLEFSEQDTGEAPEIIQGIKEMFFRRNMFIPIKTPDGRLLVATDNPHDMAKLDNIRSVCKGQEFHFAVALAEDINKYIDHFFGKYFAGEEHADLFEQLELVEIDEADDQGGDEPGAAADGVVVQMTSKIIEDAVTRRASDIHIEGLPGKRGTSIRFRIDGECSHYQNIPFLYKRSLVSRLKILAKLDISERRLPQDGKIKFKTRQRQSIELRVATVPTVGGNEDVVLRVLASGNQALPLDRVDLQEHNLVALKKLLDQPYGLILCCGPTGSGKTTTLHAAL
ncbi:MAG: type II secretion system protein E, partial [Deltaproteobacteria bacterium CG23_combo_of_CG06-09_8_20_14_all_60_8]